MGKQSRSVSHHSYSFYVLTSALSHHITLPRLILADTQRLRTSPVKREEVVEPPCCATTSAARDRSYRVTHELVPFFTTTNAAFNRILRYYNLLGRPWTSLAHNICARPFASLQLTSLPQFPPSKEQRFLGTLKGTRGRSQDVSNIKLEARGSPASSASWLPQ